VRNSGAPIAADFRGKGFKLRRRAVEEEKPDRV